MDKYHSSAFKYSNKERNGPIAENIQETEVRKHDLLEGLLLGADDSESWLLHGLSQPDKLRDCRPRPSSVTSGRARDDSCPLLGKSILLRTAHRSVSARSVNATKKGKTKVCVCSASATGYFKNNKKNPQLKSSLYTLLINTDSL